LLTKRFEDALVYAAELHSRQNRKRSQVPYIAHLLGVTALVLEDGGDEDEAIAALLHDAVEDQGGLQTLEAIRERFGEHVAALAAPESTFTDPKPLWRCKVPLKRWPPDSLVNVSPAIRFTMFAPCDVRRVSHG
jgi:hypothetical protein